MKRLALSLLAAALAVSLAACGRPARNTDDLEALLEELEDYAPSSEADTSQQEGPDLSQITPPTEEQIRALLDEDPKETYTLLGLAWLIAKPFKKRVLGVGVATVVVSLIRYLCSFLSGYVVWKDYDYAFEWMTNFGWGQAIANMGENALCWLYSAVYNATYMIPEAILTAVVAVVLCATVPMLFQEQK